MLSTLLATSLSVLASAAAPSAPAHVTPHPALETIDRGAAPAADARVRALSESLRADADENVRRLAHGERWGRAQQPDERRTALLSTLVTSFTQWASDTLAYDELFLDYVEAQARELANACEPEFSNAEAARTSVASQIGGSYALLSTWFNAPPTGSSYATLALSSSQTGALDQVALFPWTFAAVDLSAHPDFVNAALAGVNAASNDAFFYSARTNGSLVHTGVAKALPGSGTPTLALWPDTVIGPGSVIGGPEVALLRQLDAVLAGLDWGFVLAYAYPTYTVPSWNYDPNDPGMLRQAGPCQGVEECLLAAEAVYKQALANAEAAYNAHIQLEFHDFFSDAQAISESRNNIRALFGRAGSGGLLAGANQSAWNTYFSGFSQSNWAEFMQGLANAANNRRNARCNALHNLRAAAKECVKNCPEYWDILPFLDALIAQQGC